MPRWCEAGLGAEAARVHVAAAAVILAIASAALLRAIGQPGSAGRRRHARHWFNRAGGAMLVGAGAATAAAR